MFTALLLVRGLSQAVSLSSFACYVAATILFAGGCVFLYWTFAGLTLRYGLDGNGLTIHWGFVRQVVPLASIEKLVPGSTAPSPQITGVNWPGYHVGRAEVERLGDTIFYSTHASSSELLYVVTPAQTYGISVPDSGAFTKAVEAQRERGPTVALRQVARQSGPAARPFWQDRIAMGLALAAILAWFAALGVVFARYGDLPQSLAISFPPLEVTRVAAKSELLTLPTTALGVLLVNLVIGCGVHAWERMTSRLLLLAGAGLQGVFLVGAAIAVS